MAKLNWHLGNGKRQTGELVVVSDDQDSSWTRAGLGTAIADYQATAEYTVDQKCLAELIRDGRAVETRCFTCVGRGI
jgi:hypothetical protein